MLPVAGENTHRLCRRSVAGALASTFPWESIQANEEIKGWTGPPASPNAHETGACAIGSAIKTGVSNREKRQDQLLAMTALPSRRPYSGHGQTPFAGSKE
jgi:hypothetical protein